VPHSPHRQGHAQTYERSRYATRTTSVSRFFIARTRPSADQRSVRHRRAGS
jgi:hypothetical protein